MWPTDPEFRRFAAKVADACTVVINRGVFRVSPTAFCPKSDTCCPLGAVCLLARDCGARYPGAHAVPMECPDQSAKEQFILGFDDPPYLDVRSDNPYYLLGRAYRKRFPGKAKR